MLGVNHCLPPSHMSKGFVYLHNAKELIKEFAIDYMVHPTFHANKAFKEQVEKYMNDTFGTSTQPFIINTTKIRIPVF